MADNRGFLNLVGQMFRREEAPNELSPIELRSKSATEERCAYCHAGDGTLDACTGCGTKLHAECRAELSKCPTLACTVRLAQAPAPAPAADTTEELREVIRHARWAAVDFEASRAARGLPNRHDDVILRLRTLNAVRPLRSAADVAMERTDPERARVARLVEDFSARLHGTDPAARDAAVNTLDGFEQDAPGILSSYHVQPVATRTEPSDEWRPYYGPDGVPLPGVFTAPAPIIETEPQRPRRISIIPTALGLAVAGELAEMEFRRRWRLVWPFAYVVRGVWRLFMRVSRAYG